MKKHYLPKDDIGQMRWLNNFVAKLHRYQEMLEISEEVLQQLVEDAQNLSTLQNAIEDFKQYSMQLTVYRNMLRGGKTVGAMPIVTPAPVTPILVGNNIATNILGRAANQVRNIKAHFNYNEPIGQDLSIIGEEKTSEDYTDIKPEIDYNMHNGYPNILWKKGTHQGIHIYVNRGDGNGYGEYPYLDTKPDYLDEYPLPAPNQKVVWKYKAIYIEDDEEVGRVSNELSVTVTGTI